jgi:hypothetical protein
MVYIPAIDRQITLGQYLKVYRTAKANPEVEFTCGLTTWWPTKGRDVVQQFVDGMMERISDGIPYSKREVKS